MTTTKNRLKKAKDVFTEGLSRYFAEISEAFDNAKSLSELQEIQEESVKQTRKLIKCPVKVFNNFAARSTEKVKIMDDMYLLFDLIYRYKYPDANTKKILKKLIGKMCNEIKEWDTAYKAYYRTCYQEEFLRMMIDLAQNGNQAWNTRLCVRSVLSVGLYEAVEEKCRQFPDSKKVRTAKTTLFPIKSD